MTLGRKIISRNVALLLSVGLLAASALWGLLTLRQQVGTVFTQNTELTHLLLIGEVLKESRSALAAADYARAQDLLKDAADDLLGQGMADAARLKAMRRDYPEYYAWDRQVREDVLDKSLVVSSEIQEAIDARAGGLVSPADLDPAVDRMRRAAEESRGFTTAAQQLADRTLQIALILVWGLSVTILFSAWLMSRWHYNSVMGPLERLRRWVGRVGGGDFPPPLEVSGDLEFRQLMGDVNQMARQLHEFYHSLDEKVQQTSRELVRSQRLASVGFLAAGVAHEINNPLNIMTGYAELTINRLARGFDPDAAEDARRAMAVIRDEAFRCKQIISKLLSMARGLEANREKFSLRQLAIEVSGMIDGLKPFHNRHLELKFDPDQPLEICANISEIKQVLLNLLTNAMEAVKPGQGRVDLVGRREGDWVALEVRDNGRGMTPQTLERIFEPFFTEKRGVGEPGTGLGLCISHAIIESHGGKIIAASDGPDRGSVFTLRLPAARRGEGPEAAPAAKAQPDRVELEAR
ncbi:MAG: ATP-binding protein [Tepidisphaeraceae bacterium]|jgi:signal transduction histidine kinase